MHLPCYTEFNLPTAPEEKQSCPLIYNTVWLFKSKLSQLCFICFQVALVGHNPCLEEDYCWSDHSKPVLFPLSKDINDVVSSWDASNTTLGWIVNDIASGWNIVNIVSLSLTLNQLSTILQGLSLSMRSFSAMIPPTNLSSRLQTFQTSIAKTVMI